MKIAITSQGPSLESMVHPSFGRCRYFLIVDSETGELEAIDNESAAMMGGAGPQAASTISKAGATVLITGNVGPNAFDALASVNIKVVTGASGKVAEAIENYKRGLYEVPDAPTVDSHAGIN